MNVSRKIQIIRNIIFLTLVFLSNCFDTFSQSKQAFQDSIKVQIKNVVSDSLKAVSYYDAAIYAFQPLNDLELSHAYVDSAMYYSRIANVEDFEAKCHFLYGLIERFKGNYDLALEHLNKNIDHFKKDSINKPYSLFQIAAVNAAKGDRENSLKILYEILKIFEKEKDSFAMASTYNSIAIDYYEMKKTDEALNNLENALEIFINLNEKKDIANLYRNIGELYLSKNDTITGLKNVEKSLKVAKEINENYEIGYSLYVLGTAYIRTQPKKGLQYLLESEVRIKSGNYKSLLTGIYISLGQYYTSYNNSIMAISSYEKALKLTEELQVLPPKEKIYKGLAEVNKYQSNFEKANDYLSKYVIVKDSLLNIENLKTINQLEIKYQTEKKENEILALSSQKFKDDLVLSKQQTKIRRLSLGLLAAVLLFGGLFIIFRQRSRNQKQKALITAIADTQIEERKRIAQDLHDSVGGTLALAKNKLESLIKTEKGKSKEATELLQTLKNTNEQIRQISHNMMPGELVKFGLVSAVQSTLEQIDENELKTHLYTYDLEHRIDHTKEIHLFRIIQEIIQNVLKHSKANTLNIHLNKYAKKISLLIEDDGVGFAISNSPDGIGLQNIKNRVAFLNGKFQIDSGVGKGTTFNIQIPL